MSDNKQKQSFPLKKIEKLVKIATTHELDYLEVAGVKIVPRRTVSPLIGAENKKFSNVNTRSLDSLSDQQREDMLLFGEILTPEKEQ